MSYISTLLNNHFLKSSGIVLIATVLTNFLQYLFNVVAGKMLGPEHYGEVVSIINLGALVFVPGTVLTMILAKDIARMRGQGKTEEINKLYSIAVKYSIVASVVLVVLLLILNNAIANFLKLPAIPLALFWLLIPASLLSTATRGALQGLQKFIPFSVGDFLNALGKLVFSLVLISVGFTVIGVVWALILGSLLAFAYGTWVLRKHIPLTLNRKIPLKNIGAYLPPYTLVIFISTIFLSLFANVDVILAKRYLPDAEAGIYAAVSVLGKIVLYGSLAVITVMFPMVSEAKANNTNQGKKLLYWSLASVSGLSLLIVGIFALVPKLMVTLLFSSDYLAVVPYLVSFGVVMVLVALSRVFITYFIAENNTRFIYIFGIMTIAQIVLLTRYHENISQIISVLLWTSAALVVGLIGIYIMQIYRLNTNPQIPTDTSKP